MHPAGARGEREVELGPQSILPGHCGDTEAPQELGGSVAEGVRCDGEDQLNTQIGLQQLEDVAQSLGEGHCVHDHQDPLAVPYRQPVPLLDQCWFRRSDRHAIPHGLSLLTPDVRGVPRACHAFLARLLQHPCPAV